MVLALEGHAPRGGCRKGKDYRAEKYCLHDRRKRPVLCGWGQTGRAEESPFFSWLPTLKEEGLPEGVDAAQTFGISV